MTLILVLFLLAASALSCQKESVEEVHEDFVLSQNRIVFDCGGGSKSVQVWTENNWEITRHPYWVSLSRHNGTTLVVTVAAYDGESVRSGKIYMYSQGNERVLDVRQLPEGKLCILNQKNVTLSDRASEITVEIEANVSYRCIVSQGQEWISRKGSDNKISNGNITNSSIDEVRFDISANGSSARAGIIIFQNSQYSLSDTLYLYQQARNEKEAAYRDGDVVILQKSSKGNVNIVVLGDGFTSEHLEKNGHFEKSARLAVEHFFELEPYATYRDFFNVYMVAAESVTDQVGSGGLWGSNFHKTRFETSFGSGTAISCNDQVVFEYVDKVQEIQEEDPVLCILILNVDRYAGTCYMYMDGTSIAMCPMCTLGEHSDFRALIHHEAGGHGFGFFADEYVYYEQRMPQSNINDIKKWQEYGYQMNLDFVDDPSTVHWTDFIDLENYTMVGMYEGGQEYRYGVWRSEENSCMNDNIPYYSVWCRYLIYKRIMELSGLESSKEEFLANDSPDQRLMMNVFSRKTEFVPTGPPVLKMSRSR